jgi:hypothetical protein
MQINHFHVSLDYVSKQQDDTCHGEMDKAPVLYSGGSGFISLSPDRLCSTEILYIFPQFILVSAEIVTCFCPEIKLKFCVRFVLLSEMSKFWHPWEINHSHTVYRQTTLLHWNSKQVSEALKWRQPASAGRLLITDAITSCLHYVVSSISVLFVIFSAYSFFHIDPPPLLFVHFLCHQSISSSTFPLWKRLFICNFCTLSLFFSFLYLLITPET